MHMSNTDFIPHSDGAFNLWQVDFVQDVEQNATAWGIAIEDVTLLKAKKSVWDAAFSKASNKQNRTSADVQAKDDARFNYVDVIRPFTAQWLSNNSKVTDSDRTRLGLTVKTGTRTPVAKPDTCPVATIDFSIRKQHSINFSDEASPRSKAKPEGVHGCEIYMKVDGEAPKLVSELVYQATCTSSPYVVTFDGTQAGKTVYYWLRWVNTRGEAGPWSSVASAMVVG